jgi:hypothetical protein
VLGLGVLGLGVPVGCPPPNHARARWLRGALGGGLGGGKEGWG